MFLRCISFLQGLTDKLQELFAKKPIFILRVWTSFVPILDKVTCFVLYFPFLILCYLQRKKKKTGEVLIFVIFIFKAPSIKIVFVTSDIIYLLKPYVIKIWFYDNQRSIWLHNEQKSILLYICLGHASRKSFDKQYVQSGRTGDYSISILSSIFPEK